MADAITVPFDVRLMNSLATIGYTLCVLLVLAAGGWWLMRQPLFQLREIEVGGEVTHISAATLRANLAPRLIGNFFLVDLARARAAFEAAPWVRKAVVRREFPDKLRVTLTEHEPAAYWGEETDSRLIDTYGQVFDANLAEAPDDLPRLAGPIDQAGHVFGMYRVLAPMFATFDQQLDQLTLTNRGSWQALLDTGAEVELGRGNADEVAVRTERFLRTLTRVVDKYGRTVDAVQSADLRHRNGYALRMRGISTIPADAKTPPKKK